MMPCIETFTGELLHPLRPCASTIFIEDIAHHLSNQCRFSGATRKFYSVAEHSVRVSWLVSELGGTLDEQLDGLLHDASEYGLVDFVTPLKRHWLFGFFYRRAERRLQRAICRRFQLHMIEPEVVSYADRAMLAAEVRDLMPAHPEHWQNLVEPIGDTIYPWSSAMAETAFLARFRELDGKR